MDYTLAWLIWIAYFVVVEVGAIVDRKKDDTLSEHVWKWFSIKEEGPLWRLRRFLLLALTTWASLHFLTGGRF